MLKVMAGQGSIAVELLRQLPPFDAVFVAVGGGGLIGGIGAYIKCASPQTEVVGCWPENSPVLYESIKAGRILDVAEKPTLSESTAGGLEPGSVTLEICSHVIDSSVLVSETEILDAMRKVRALKGWVIEGAAAVAVAVFPEERRTLQGKESGSRHLRRQRIGKSPVRAGISTFAALRNLPPSVRDGERFWHQQKSLGRDLAAWKHLL